LRNAREWNASVTIADADMSIPLGTAQALKLWHNVSLAQVHGNEVDLSTRQVSILLTIYMEAPPHTIRELAKKLKVSKPVITRALDSMGKLDLVTRRRDAADKRNVLVQRTVKGALYLDRLADLIGMNSKNL
jgi:DNA-binding MarR family transcriptional regulator